MKIEASASHREIRSSKESLTLMHVDDKGQMAHQHRRISRAASSAIGSVPIWPTRPKTYFQAARSTKVDLGHPRYQ
jgi:hypothetical protein